MLKEVFQFYGATMLLGVVMLLLTVPGVYLVITGLKELRRAKQLQLVVQRTTYIKIVFGCLLLLPMSFWILQSIAWGFGISLGSWIFESIFE